MNLIQGIFLVVASMLGTGILTTSGLMASKLNNPYQLLTVWIIGGILSICGAICYGFVLNRHTHSGGEATFIELFYKKSWGFITAILSFLVGFAASNAASSIALTNYLTRGLGIEISSDSYLPKYIAAGAILLMTFVHTGKKYGIIIQTILAIFKFSLLLSLTFFGFYFLNNTPTNIPFEINQNSSVGTLNDWTLCIMFAIFSYSGWNAAIYSATEFKEAKNTVPKSMIIGCLLITLLYCFINLVIINIIPFNQLTQTNTVISELVNIFWGKEFDSIFSLLIAFALLSSVGVSAFAGPRVLHHILLKTNKISSHSVPNSLIIGQAIVSIILMFTGSFEVILSIMGTFLGIAPMLVIFSIYKKNWNAQPVPQIIKYLIAPLYICTSFIIVCFSLIASTKSLIFVCCLFVLAIILAKIEK